MAPQKGKQGTKGQKQILEENQATLNFYRNMVFIASGTFLSVTCVLTDSFTLSSTLLFLFSAAVYIGSYQFMAYMAKPSYSDAGQLFDSGVDLNMEGGIAEHVKDLIILTSGCQLLSLISNYFWLLWLLAPARGFWILWCNVLSPWLSPSEGKYYAPARGFWILWCNVLSPWFFQQQPPTETTDADEKKQRKMERRMRRH